MSAQTVNSQLAFHLPRLSYIDTRWEEPNLRTPASVTSSRHKGLFGWLSELAAAFFTWRGNNAATAELACMSDHELQDIGVSRSDLSRLFDPAFNQDLQQRGTLS